MKWDSLLSNKRFSINDKTTPKVIDPLVASYQKDGDRVLYSSAFRRLQGKTQVHLFPDTDYVRTRLTHTLEVTSIARILARAVLMDKSVRSSIAPTLKSKKQTDAAVVETVAAACFAHDIGNAPFGHIGEYAIRSWFHDRLQPDSGSKWLLRACNNDAARLDFECFDGNAQGFRILTRLQGWKEHGGLQLTYATLGSFMKYPFGSRFAQKHGKKFGFFQSERKFFEMIAEELGLEKRTDSDLGDTYMRHPLSYLMEASDDIAYLTTDIEDAVKTGMIPFRSGKAILHSIASSGESFDDKRYRQIKMGTQDEIKFLRSASMLAMIEYAKTVFINNLKSILVGDYPQKDLIDGDENAKAFRKKIRAMLNRNVYLEQDKVKKEAGAYEVVRTLLDLFGEMIEDYFSNGIRGMNDRNQNLLVVMTRGKTNKKIDSPYEGYRMLVDFVSGMTDRYASKLSHDIRGRKLG